MPIAIATPQAFDSLPSMYDKATSSWVSHAQTSRNLHFINWIATAATKPSMHLRRLVRLLLKLCLLHFCGGAVAAAQPLLVLLESAMKWLHSPALHLP